MIGIVAHRLRADRVSALARQFPDALVSMDHQLPSAKGCADNHLSILKQMLYRSHDPWNIILEDDAVPVKGFAEQAASALDQSESPIVGLYLGTANPRSVTQQAVIPAIEKARATDARWIISDRFLSGPGYAIRADAMQSLVAFLSRNGGPIDSRINDWAGMRRLDIWYTAPSLVDHADGPSLIGSGGDPDAHKRNPRHAHMFGTRRIWTKSAVRMARSSQ